MTIRFYTLRVPRRGFITLSSFGGLYDIIMIMNDEGWAGFLALVLKVYEGRAGLQWPMIIHQFGNTWRDFSFVILSSKLSRSSPSVELYLRKPGLGICQVLLLGEKHHRVRQSGG